MSDLEYDTLDELYFVQSYKELNKKLNWEDEILRDTLKSLHEKGWIKCFLTPTEEIFNDDIDIETQYHKYFYLASKAGLFAHNNFD